MSANIAVQEPEKQSWLMKGRALLLGAPLPGRLSERVDKTIQQEQEQSEILVSVIQLIAIATFAVLYTLTPKGFGADVTFEPVPMTLGVYAGFTVIRLWLALKRSLPRWFIAISIVVDVAVLLITIWSFHLQYDASPALYLKAPTLMYVFILIALRTLRFEPAMVILTGVAASVGWVLAVIYAVAHEQACNSMQLVEAMTGADACNITHMFPEYTSSDQILLGAELDKIVSMMMVTIILAIALVRARKLLIRATAEHQAAADLSRFFAPEIAGRIRDTDSEIKPGDAELPHDRSSRLYTSHREASAARGDCAAVCLPKPRRGGDFRRGRQCRQVHGGRHPRKLRCGCYQRSASGRGLARFGQDFARLPEMAARAP